MEDWDEEISTGVAPIREMSSFSFEESIPKHQVNQTSRGFHSNSNSNFGRGSRFRFYCFLCNLK